MDGMDFMDKTGWTIPAGSRTRLLELPDGCEITCAGDRPYVVAVPDGVGKFLVTSQCGEWKGEISIYRDNEGVRWLDWLSMMCPR